MTDGVRTEAWKQFQVRTQYTIASNVYKTLDLEQNGDNVINCLYCGNRISESTRSRTIRSGFSALFTAGISQTTSTKSFKINCGFCDRSYTAYFDLNWRYIWHNIKYTSNFSREMKRVISRGSVDTFAKGLIGAAKINNEYHLLIIRGEKKYVMYCNKINNRYVARSLKELY